MLKEVATTINGVRVTSTPFPARFKFKYALTAFRIIPVIMKNITDLMKTLEGFAKDGLFGEDAKEKDLEIDTIFDLEKLMALDVKPEMLKDLDFSPIGNIVDDFLNIMSPEEFLDFAEKILAFTYVGNQNAKDNFDAVFEDDFWLIFKVLIFAFKANNFFKKAHTGESQEETT